MYAINLWGSDPNLENDDCHTGIDVASLAEAEDIVKNIWTHFNKGYYGSSTAFFEIDGPGYYKLIPNPNYRPSKDYDSDWRRENAMQNGMAFGCEGYNEVMGCD